MSRFEPVFLPADRGLNGKASQTLLRHYDRCPRSGYLYQLHKGSGSSPEMMRGSALHAVIEQSIRAAIDADERTIPPEIVKAIVNEVLADPAYAVPLAEHDYLREMAYRWGSQFVFDPGAVIALETLFVLDLGGFEVRAKIDYAELLDDGAAVAVRDWKSSRAMPGFEEVSRKRDDGTRSAKAFQLVQYALVLAFGVPVRIEGCLTCEGEGSAASGFGIESSGAPAIVTCPACDGRGAIEIREPFPVAGRAQRFDLSFVYPGILRKSTGEMGAVPVSLTRLELEEYRASLDGLLRRLAHSEESGDWPAVASDDACSECPARSMCPIPAEVRSFKGVVNTAQEAADAAERLHRDKAEQAARLKELREWAKAHGPIRFGGDMVMDFGVTEAERIADKDGLRQAVDRAVSYGESFEWAEHVKRSTSTPFRTRQLSALELAEMDQTNDAEGSTDDRSDEQRLDEKYGSDAPF